ncbi:MAG: Veg family protein [Anaeroplasmataceae bacterium]
MAKLQVFEINYEALRDELTKLLNKQITLTIINKSKINTYKATITLVSTKLFCVDVILSRESTQSMSFTFIDIKTNKIKIEELPDLSLFYI